MLGPGLALGPDENTAPLARMYRWLVVLAGGRCHVVSIVGRAAEFQLSTHVKPDTHAMLLAHRHRKCISLKGNPEKTWLPVGLAQFDPVVTIDGYWR